jgi:hypothetical protein
MNQPTVKSCKDCRHAQDQRGMILCRAPQNLTPDTVYGGMGVKASAFACIHREAGKIGCRVRGLCGNEARWWEPKIKEELPLMNESSKMRIERDSLEAKWAQSMATASKLRIVAEEAIRLAGNLLVAATLKGHATPERLKRYDDQIGELREELKRLSPEDQKRQSQDRVRRGRNKE